MGTQPFSSTLKPENLVKATINNGFEELRQPLELFFYLDSFFLLLLVWQKLHFKPNPFVASDGEL